MLNRQDPALSPATRRVHSQSKGDQGLPEEVWTGFLRDFRTLVEPTTDAPLDSIYAAGLQALSMAIGPQVSVSYGQPMYPNLYIALVGASGSTRKTTVMRSARDVLSMAFDPDHVRFARSVGSGPGLLELFTNYHDARPGEALEPIPGQRVILEEPELTSLLKKTHRTGTGDSLEVLLNLYDGSDLAPRTRRRPITVVQPYFGILSATTPENLDANVTALDIESGLLPRFAFFWVIERPPKPYPEPRDEHQLQALADRLRDIDARAADVGRVGPMVLGPDERGLWEEIYWRVIGPARQAGGSPRAMLERIPNHVLKIATLYAVQDGRAAISTDDLLRAGVVGTHLAENAGLIPGGLHEARTVTVEDKIIRYLKSLAPEEWVPGSALHRLVGGRIKSAELNGALAALQRLDVIDVEYVEVRGRKVPYYRAAIYREEESVDDASH